MQHVLWNILSTKKDRLKEPQEWLIPPLFQRFIQKPILSYMNCAVQAVADALAMAQAEGNADAAAEAVSQATAEEGADAEAVADAVAQAITMTTGN